MQKKLILLLLALFTMYLLTPAHAGETDATPVRTVVFPFQNSTGDSSLDWLAIALQHDITNDLWYVKTLETLPLPYLKQLEVVEKMDENERIAYAKNDLEVDHLWIGSYEYDGNESSRTLKVLLKIFSAESGKLLSQSELKGTVEQIKNNLSSKTIEITESIGTKIDDSEKPPMLSEKTRSVEAWKMNAQGFRLQKLHDEVSRRKALPEWLNARIEDLPEEWLNALTRATMLDYQYAEAWNNLGWYFLNTNADSDHKAREAFAKALKLKGFLVDALIGMGDSVLRDNRTTMQKERALEFFQKGLELNPSLSFHRRYMLNAYSTLKRYPEAVSTARSMLKDRKQPKDVMSMLEITDRLLNMAKDGSADAAQCLLETLRNKNFYARLMSAMALTDMGQHHKEVLSVLIEGLKSTDEMFMEFIPCALKEIIKIDDTPYLIKALKNADDDRSQRELAMILADMGEAEAIQRFFIEKGSMALFAVIKDRFLFDEEYIGKLGESRDPYVNASGHYFQSIYALETGENTKALEYAHRALESMKKNNNHGAFTVLCLWAKGQALLEIGSPKEALTIFERSESLLPLITERERAAYGKLFGEYTLLYKARALRANKDTNGALECYEKIEQSLGKIIKDAKHNEREIEKLRKMVMKEVNNSEGTSSSREKVLDGKRHFQAL